MSDTRFMSYAEIATASAETAFGLSMLDWLLPIVGLALPVGVLTLLCWLTVP